MASARASISACFAALLVLSPGGGAAADAANGGVIAERWCAHCHAVAPRPQRSDAGPPSLAQIGRNPAMDAGALAAFLMTPHPRMPDMSLTRREIEDLLAFIRAQAK